MDGDNKTKPTADAQAPSVGGAVDPSINTPPAQPAEPSVEPAGAAVPAPEPVATPASTPVPEEGSIQPAPGPVAGSMAKPGFPPEKPANLVSDTPKPVRESSPAVAPAAEPEKPAGE